MALFAAVLVVGANAFILSPILSEVAGSLATEPHRIAWSISSFGAATALSSLFLSFLVDRTGARVSLTAAALLLAFAQLVSAASWNWMSLAGAQALAGISVGVLLPGAYATTAATAPTGREAARLGFVLTGWAISLVLAVPAAALVTDYFGWRVVFAALAAISALVAAGLWRVMPGGSVGAAVRTNPLHVLRIPGVAFLLAIVFVFMTAFYGTFSFFGEGMRRAFDLSAKGTGLFVLAYGIGFGGAGLVIGRLSVRISRLYMVAVFGAIATAYFAWRFALEAVPAALVASTAWGFMNQFGLNTLLVSLNLRAAHARGAVMGLNSAIAYSAVFVGPILMGEVFAVAGFTGVTTLAGLFVTMVAIGVFIAGRTGPKA